MPPLPAWFRDERILLLCSGSGSSLPANNGGCCQRAPMAARLSGSIGGEVGEKGISRLSSWCWGGGGERTGASLCFLVLAVLPPFSSPPPFQGERGGRKQRKQ